MMNDKQIQKAGDGSQQIQAGQIIINQGITEERARQIVDEKIQEVIQRYSLEAHDVAEQRIKDFSNELIPRLVRENLLDSLKDPSVQMTLREAEKTAVGAERETDHELLSELLIHRVKKGSDYTIKAGVNQAVKIVDEISDEALLALTVAHAIESFIPVAGDIKSGLETLNNLFSKLLYDQMPSGTVWIDHLDILNAVRIIGIRRRLNITDIYSESLSGYLDIGIAKDSEAYTKAVQIIKSVGIPGDVLIDHELREGYVRLKTVHRTRFDLLSIHGNTNLDLNGKIVKIPFSQQLSDKQKQALSDVYDMYETDKAKRDENIKKFQEMLEGYEALNEVRLWWDQISGTFSITAAGKALAQANAKRCDPGLPDLD